MALFGNGTVGAPTTPPGSEGGASGKGRTRPAGAPILGIAMSREDYKKKQLDLAAPPPSPLLSASDAIGSAKASAERQRKRAAGGEALLAGSGKAGPGATLTPKTLVGG